MTMACPICSCRFSGDLPPEHAEFHSACLSFVPVTTLDELRRPWGRQDGKPVFVRAPRYSTLASAPICGWASDRELQAVWARRLDAGCGYGLEFATRQRNKFARAISRLETANNSAKLEFRVNEAIGCVLRLTVLNFLFI
ncbi:hypothetical protein B0H10DRAFT_2379030 [Mycena sp. CBHHK59/15]|nr:hypothetical protein B0H10DRAFT_2379030 [Mycena sp. CBHHK59/15]